MIFLRYRYKSILKLPTTYLTLKIILLFTDKQKVSSKKISFINTVLPNENIKPLVKRLFVYSNSDVHSNITLYLNVYTNFILKTI